MAKKIVLLVGTKKGAFILEGDNKRKSWKLRGPFCEAWPINHVVADPGTGAVYAGGGNEWFGPAVWKTTDLGKTWTHSSEGLAYKEGEEPIKAVWSLARRDGTLYAGVEPAGLFRSGDGGITWEHVEGLRKHPSRPEWQPGGGGLILHHIVPHPDDGKQVWVGISTGGVFHTADGGKSWESIEAGLPSTFGFPAVVHPREPETLFLLPLNGDVLGRYVPDGKAAVWRTRDGGAKWKALRKGLPQKNVFFGVLRQAMAADPLKPCGVYFGTSTGSVYASADEGESWTAIAEHMPVITSVETLVIDD